MEETFFLISNTSTLGEDIIAVNGLSVNENIIIWSIYCKCGIKNFDNKEVEFLKIFSFIFRIAYDKAMCEALLSYSDTNSQHAGRVRLAITA